MYHVASEFGGSATANVPNMAPCSDAKAMSIAKCFHGADLGTPVGQKAVMLLANYSKWIGLDQSQRESGYFR